MKTSTASAILAAAFMLTAGAAQGTETELSPARLAATVTIYISQCGGKLNEKQRAAFTAAVRRPNFDRKKYEDVITQWRNETIPKVGKTNVCPALADMMESTIDLLSTLDGEYVVD